MFYEVRQVQILHLCCIPDCRLLIFFKGRVTRTSRTSSTYVISVFGDGLHSCVSCDCCSNKRRCPLRVSADMNSGFNICSLCIVYTEIWRKSSTIVIFTRCLHKFVAFHDRSTSVQVTFNADVTLKLRNWCSNHWWIADKRRIKTKHCEGPQWGRRRVVSVQSQSEEIQVYMPFGWFIRTSVVWTCFICGTSVKTEIKGSLKCLRIC